MQTETDPKPAEQDKLIAELESQLGRPRSVGVMPAVAALALAGALGLIYLEWPEVAYFFSAKTPIDLGSEGAYRPEAMVSNRYVQIHGAPSWRGAYGADRNGPFVVVGILESPVLLKRPALPSERWEPPAKPPRPDQRPFMAYGRLLSRAQATKYVDAFVKHEGFGELTPRWLLLEGERPGAAFAGVAYFTFLLAFAAVNAWLLARGLTRWLASSRAD